MGELEQNKIGYKPKYPLFRALTNKEMEDFKAGAIDCFKIKPIEVIHPITRKEMIRMLVESLREQGEL